MSRKDRRNNDPKILERRSQFAGGGVGIFNQLPLAQTTSGDGRGPGTSGGWGLGDNVANPAGGQAPSVNPFLLPKAAGINVTSQTFPSNYYVEWNLSTWRMACDQAIKMGNCTSIATLFSWAYECSPFIQSLFTKLGAAIATWRNVFD